MAAASEALVVTNEKQILEALTNNEAMTSLIDKAKAIATSLITQGDFDVEDPEHRAEIKRIGRRVGRTAKDINDCKVEYLRSTKAKIKLVEERGKRFVDELKIIRDSVDGPALKWEQDRKNVDIQMSEFGAIKLKASFSFDISELEDLMHRLEHTTKDVVEDKQAEYTISRDDVVAYVADRIARVIKIDEDAKELERLKDEKAKRDAEEIARLKTENQGLKDGTIKPPESPVELAGPEEAPLYGSSGKTMDSQMMMLSDRINEVECLCVDLYNEFATGDAHFTGEMKRLDLLVEAASEEDPF